MVRIEGKHIIIRDWRLSDLDAYTYWLQPGHLWQDFDGPYYGHMSADQIPDYINRFREKIDRDDWDSPRNGLAIADAETNTFIGQLNRYWNSKETNWLCIGIVIFFSFP